MKTPGMHLSGRLAVQVAIGLATEGQGSGIPEHLLARAREAGLTRAEIQAASDGGSFYLRDAAAVTLARAIRDGQPAQVELCRRRAFDAGLSETEAAAIEQMAMAFLARAESS